MTDLCALVERALTDEALDKIETAALRWKGTWGEAWRSGVTEALWNAHEAEINGLAVSESARSNRVACQPQQAPGQSLVGTEGGVKAGSIPAGSAATDNAAGTPLEDLIAEYERDPSRKALLDKARAELAPQLAAVAAAPHATPSQETDARHALLRLARISDLERENAELREDAAIAREARDFNEALFETERKRALAAEAERDKLAMEMPDYKQCCAEREKAEAERDKALRERDEFKPTHRHADGGLYQSLGKIMVHTDSDQWEPAIRYRNTEGMEFVRLAANFMSRMTPLPEPHP